MKRVFAVVVSTALVALGSVALLPAQPAHAAGVTYRWSGEGDGHAWSDQHNWTPSSGTPEDGDSVIIEKNPTITGVPTVSLIQLATSGEDFPGSVGPTLKGDTGIPPTITTIALTWTRGHVAANIVVSGTALLSGPLSGPGPVLENGYTALGNPPVTFTNNGLVTQTGTFVLNGGPGAGARIVNEGTWLPGGEATITSSSCCTDATGTIDNDGVIAPSGKLILDHAKFIARRHSVVSGVGTLEIRGGVATLDGPWTVSGGTKLQLTLNAVVNLGGTTTIGGEIQQEDTSEIQGTGVFAGSGKYRWLGGKILGTLTLGSNLTGVIEGGTIPPREISSGLAAGVLTVDGTVDQKSDILMNGKIVNNGTWHVPADTHTTIGAGSLTTPPRKFRNAGTIKADSGAELSLKLLELSNPTDKGAIEGGGTVSLSGGIHQLSGGAIVRGSGTTLRVIDAAEVHGTGTLKLDQARVEIDNAKLWGTFKIGGGGRMILVRGTIVGDLTTGPDVTLILPVQPGPVVLDGATGDGILRTQGDVRQNHPEVIYLIADAKIVNSGTWIMDQASFEGSGGTFANEGLLTITGSGSAKFAFVRFVNTGRKVRVDSDAAMEFTGFSPRSIDEGVIDLGGGRIVTQLPLVLSGSGGGGTLIGNGRVEGDVRNAGVVAPGHGSTPGSIVVSGVYRQVNAGTLFLDIPASSSWDRISAGALELDGTLGLDKVGSAPLGANDRFLLTGSDSRTGRFDRVFGLNALGAGWRLRYLPTDVWLKHL